MSKTTGITVEITLDNRFTDQLETFRREFPAASTSTDWLDRVVTQGHADACAKWGHATWTVDGVVRGICPRCGVNTEAAAL